MSYQAHETAVIDAGCEIGEGTHIWHFSHIMTGCVIGRACNIGQNVVVSPGVVVTKDIPAYALVVGNPSRLIGWVSEYGHRLVFDSEGFATCPESGQRYRLHNHQVVETGRAPSPTD